MPLMWPLLALLLPLLSLLLPLLRPLLLMPPSSSQPHPPKLRQ